MNYSKFLLLKVLVMPFTLFFYCMIAISALSGLSGCSNEEKLSLDGTADATTPLSISVSNIQETRIGGLISGAKLPDGSSLGLFLTKEDGSSAYDIPYDNIKYISSISGSNQVWTATPDPIQLTGTKANVYAYYPYDDAYTNITAIPIDVTENKDVMWATHAENVCNASPTATLPMNHALAVIRLSLSKGDYSSAGAIESITVQGDCIASKGTLNAKDGTLTVTDAGAEVDFGDLGDAATLSSTAKTVDQLVVPVNTTGILSVNIKMDGKTFYVTSGTAFSTERAKAYRFGLAFTDGILTMTNVSVDAIAEVPMGDVTPGVHRVPTITWEEAKSIDGIYGIYKGKPVIYSEAEKTYDGELDGVSIVMYGRVIQISNCQLNSSKWGDTIQNIPGTSCGSIGGGVSGKSGYLPQADGTFYTWENNITQLYYDWPNATTTALADTTGWSNTEALILAQSNDTYLGPQTKKFREDYSVNHGHSDWYVPAAGQLAFIYLNMNEINTLLVKISEATVITPVFYWSSTEYGSSDAWGLSFLSGNLIALYQSSDCRVLFCRDITE